MAISKLSQFGHAFQIKSIVSLMTDKKFLEQVVDMLDDQYYDGDAKKWIIRHSKEYFIKYNKAITIDAFKVGVSSIEQEVLKTSVIETLKEVYQTYEAPDLEFVQDKTIDFFKNQALKTAIMESVEILEYDGDFDKIKSIIDEAMKAGMERDIGHNYQTMIDERYEEMARDTVETPWEVINELMQGGLGGGELGVVVAPAGAGKSWVLSAIGAAAIKNGKKIVHYSLELNEGYVGLRYDSIFTGIANQNLKFHKDEVVQKVFDLKGNLYIKYYPTKSATVHTIKAHLQRLTTLEGAPDLVIVDYADIMRDSGSSKEMRHALGNIYEDLRGLAGELQVPVWTASQANRSALDEDVIEAGKVAESYIKIMTADFVLSLSRKVEDKIGNTGRFHIIKNRFGPDGLTYPAKVNTNNGHIDIYHTDSVGGRHQQNKIDNRDNLTKGMLKNKYEQLMDTK